MRNETWRIECKMELHDARLGGKVASCWRFDYPSLKPVWHARVSSQQLPRLPGTAQMTFGSKGAAVRQLRSWRDQMLATLPAPPPKRRGRPRKVPQ